MGKPYTWGRDLGIINLGKETGMVKTKALKTLETKLKRIALRSKEDPNCVFDKLMPLFNKSNLMECFRSIDGRKAIGIDKTTKSMYERNLEENIENLIIRMKRFSYCPLPVREVLIPKDNGGTRPLGISVVEDKIVQAMYSKILNAIYEPTFRDESYGFRPGRSCHQALKQTSDDLYMRQTPVVIDMDLQNFFGTIDHKILIELLGERIQDPSFLRYLVRILKSGIMRSENFYKTDEGCPQGAICSPIISNIYAHYVIDEWLKKEVIPRCPGTTFVRYADDVCITCCNMEQAKKIHEVLPKRLRRFGLEMNEAKTRLVDMNKIKFNETNKSETFDFLGFSFYLGKSRKGRIVPKVKTSKKKIRSKLKAVKMWIKKSRSTPLKRLWLKFNSKLRGHVQYFGVSNNQRSVHLFLRKALEIFFKWINRRSQRKSISWKKFNLFMNQYPMVKAQTVFNFF